MTTWLHLLREASLFTGGPIDHILVNLDVLDTFDRTCPRELPIHAMMWLVIALILLLRLTLLLHEGQRATFSRLAISGGDSSSGRIRCHDIADPTAWLLLVA